MSFQIRAVPAEDSALAREIARKLVDTANDILAGSVSSENYRGAIARYQVLLELMTFLDERNAAEAKGEPIVED